MACHALDMLIIKCLWKMFPVRGGNFDKGAANYAGVSKEGS